MQRLLSTLAALALGGCYATVREDGRMVRAEPAFTLILPEVLPPLVVVQPGVSVVRDMDQEVFYADGYYWARQDRTWYRSHDHRAGWAPVESRYVPDGIAHSEPGRYRRYRGEEPGRSGQEHGRSDQEHGRSDQEHGRSDQEHGRSDQEHGRRDGHDGDRN